MVQRIVSLAPSNTEIVYTLGLMDRLVGVDDWSDWPSETAALPKVGPDLDVDIAAVAALRPDLVLASLSVPGMEKNVAGLVEAGLPYVVLDPGSLDEIWENIHRVGELCGVVEQAARVTAGLTARVEAVRRAAADAPRRRLYWEWWPKPIYTPGRGNWLTEISALVGGENIFAGYDLPNVRVDDPLEVVRRRPDEILLAWTGARRPDPAHVYRRPGWEALPAVVGRRVRVLEEGLFNRPSPRLVDGLEHLWQLLNGG